MTTPKPDPEWLEQFPALFGTEYEDPAEQAASDAEADRIAAARRDESPLRPKEGQRPPRFSQGAVQHIPMVAKAIERARSAGVTHSEGVVDHDYYMSNTGRGLMSTRGPYELTPQQIRTRTYRDALAHGGRSRFAHDLETYPIAVEVAERGGSACPTVILASPRDAGNREFVVCRGWTQYRTALVAIRKYSVRECCLCGKVQCAGRIDVFFLVGTGATMYVLGACSACHGSVYDEAQALADQGVPVRTDFAMLPDDRSDDWYARTGWADQKAWRRGQARP